MISILDRERRRQWHPTPVLLPRESHGRRSLVGCSSQGLKESDTTERLHFHFSLSTFMHWRRKWQLTPVFLPGESQEQRSLVGCRLWGRTESDTTEATYQQQQQTMKCLHLVLCPWICSRDSQFIVYGNLKRICILLLYENCINLNCIELVHGAFQVYYILLLFCMFILLTFESLTLKLQLKILIYLLKK